ncbi:hypothetical protein Tco_0008007 [Tanacetum coccineum]
MQTQESKIDTGKELDVDLVVTENSGTKSEVQDESSCSRNDTDTNDADIRPIYDEEPMAEYTEQYQVKSPMLDSSLYNKTTEFSNQSLESENSCLKKTVAQFQRDFSRMEAHCIALELKYQNKPLKSGCGIKHGFLSQKGSEVGKGVIEKNVNRNKMNTFSGIGVSIESDDTMNEDTPIGVASAIKEGVTPYVVDMTMEMEKISYLEDATVMGSFPPLSTPVTTTAGNAHGKSLYATVTGKPSGKKLNIHTLFTPRGNGIDVLIYRIILNSMEGLDTMLENGPWFIRNHSLILKKWHLNENLLKEDVSTILGRSSYARVMIELRADVELKDNIVMALLKIIGRAIIYVMSVLSMSGNLLGVRLVRTEFSEERITGAGRRGRGKGKKKRRGGRGRMRREENRKGREKKIRPKRPPKLSRLR